MEEEALLKQPDDRRLGDNSALPPGPPGAEFDTDEFALKNAPPSAAAADTAPSKSKDNAATERTNRRRSPSGSPSRKRRSKSRARRSPSSPRSRSHRNRRSPSPRRNRYRDYSPERRRYGRRSPDRRRYGSRGMGRDRFRGRARSSSRSLSRSASPPQRRGSRWSPKKKPNSPPLPQSVNLPPTANISNQPPPPPYGVMPPQMYGDAYGAPSAGYSQYGVPPPQSGFVQPPDAYGPAAFAAGYPPPATWGVDAYGQQQWMPPPAQMRQMPPPPQTHSTSPGAAVLAANNQQVVTNVVPSAAIPKPLHIIPDAAPGTVETSSQHDAVAQEAENQRDEIRKQRTRYLKKTDVLKRELKMLKKQRKELLPSKAPASPTTKGFIEENEKLQSQIQKKLGTIENVIDMLTGIIGEENLDKDDEVAEDSYEDSQLKGSTKSQHAAGAVLRADEKVECPPSTGERKAGSSSSSTEESSSDSSSSSSESSTSSDNEGQTQPDNEDDSSPERLKKKVIESMRMKEKEALKNKASDPKIPTRKERFNYVFYDPEMHWCQTCNIFPKTAKDFLNHLHSKDHMDKESIETPWHADMVSDQFPTHENVPIKRTPIRGLTFFVPATAWFCKLCNAWMGDLHCASTHLKSQLHAAKYNSFLEENPHYEVNWLADRQKVLNEQKVNTLPQQITSVSTTEAERKKSKKDDEKMSKKRKKKSDKKQKKKKKKSSKKYKKATSDSSTSTSSETSSSSDTDEPKKRKGSNVEVKDLDNPNPGVSIRLSMRKQENAKGNEAEVSEPSSKVLQPKATAAATSDATTTTSVSSKKEDTVMSSGKWTVVNEGLKPKTNEYEDDGIIQEWNTVQPVISESEKKLLEQLKGKLKNKPNNDHAAAKAAVAANATVAAPGSKSDMEKENRGKSERSERRDNRDSRDKRDRISSRRRSNSRSPTRSRSRGRDYRRHVRRTRSRSRGRTSPRGGWRGRRRYDRSRSRSIRRRSRSYDRRRRVSRSRSRSASRCRVEKPIVRQPEFRPRVPEKDKEKEKKASENKEKKDKPKPKPSTTTSAASNNAGKKLPFIGKMPVFKKQSSGQQGESDKIGAEQQLAAGFMYSVDGYGAQQQRPPAPTAAQIQMAMMEDVYGNAPPFHPDAGMMVDYDDLMPDPVQFVNIMGQAPPPPPPQEGDETDILPPGIDEEESEEFMPKATVEAAPPSPADKGALPKDLEDALNIIFPGEKKPGDDEDKSKASTGETHIIDDDPKLEPAELAKDGIHLVTLEDTSQLGLDEASQMSMNEPLVFNRPAATTNVLLSADMDIENSNSHSNIELPLQHGAGSPSARRTLKHEDSAKTEIVPDAPQSDNAKLAAVLPSDKSDGLPEVLLPESIPIPDSSPPPSLNHNTIPIPPEAAKEEERKTVLKAADASLPSDNSQKNLMLINDIDLDDIPQPPPSPTESEKNRRQEELDDLAMLGIDADDMAAQCM